MHFQWNGNHYKIMYGTVPKLVKENIWLNVKTKKNSNSYYQITGLYLGMCLVVSLLNKIVRKCRKGIHVCPVYLYSFTFEKSLKYSKEIKPVI